MLEKPIQGPRRPGTFITVTGVYLHLGSVSISVCPFRIDRPENQLDTVASELTQVTSSP